MTNISDLFYTIQCPSSGGCYPYGTTSLTTGWTPYTKHGGNTMHKWILKFVPCDDATRSRIHMFEAIVFTSFTATQHRSFFPSLVNPGATLLQ